MKHTNFAASVLSVVLLTGATSASAQLVPGDLTDPTRAKPQAEAQTFAIPEALQYPYISTYYVKPMVTPDEEVAIKVFVTDWNNAKVRLGDDSHAFDISLRCSADGKTWTTLEMKGVKSGDHAFNLGKLVEGAYTVGVYCKDSKGRSSHTVWQEFRSAGVREENRRDVAAEDLAQYGLVLEKDRYAIIGVAVPHADSKDHDVYLSAVKKAAAAVEVPANGTSSSVPSSKASPSSTAGSVRRSSTARTTTRPPSPPRRLRTPPGSRNSSTKRPPVASPASCCPRAPSSACPTRTRSPSRPTSRSTSTAPR